MGANKSTVLNLTSASLPIITFNNTDRVYWFYRRFHQLPDNGSETMVKGLPGGAAVKVGVIYAAEGGRSKFHLFKVRNGATLKISRVQLNEAGEAEIQYEATMDVQLLKRGLKIRMTAEHAALVSWSMGVTAAFRGVSKMIRGQEPDDTIKRAVFAVLSEGQALGSAFTLCRPSKPKAAPTANSAKKTKSRRFRMFVSKKRAISFGKRKRGSVESRKPRNCSHGSPQARSPPNGTAFLVKEPARFNYFFCQFPFDDSDDLNSKTMLTDKGLLNIQKDLFGVPTEKIPILQNEARQTQVNSCLTDTPYSSPEIVKSGRSIITEVYQNHRCSFTPDE